MQAILVAGIILLATLENSAPFLLGFFKTPPGFVFLGTVHHPADYFYYLSQFAQGSVRLATSVDLYTTEPVTASFIGWSNVLLGRLFHLVGAAPWVAYHTSVVLLTILLLYLSYRVALALFKKSLPATLTLFFFTLFHAFPIIQEGVSSYADYWNNYAVPSVRFGGVPHQLLIGISFMLCVLFLMRRAQGIYTWRVMAGLLVASAILASLQPVLWGLLLATTGATACIVFLKTRKADARGFLTVMVGGIGPAWYLFERFLTAPFLQLKLWEATQQNSLTPAHFLAATGPVFLLALFFAPRFVSSFSFSRMFIILFSFLSLGLFLSPIPALLGISHVRFMSAFTIFCLSSVASWGLSELLLAKSRRLRIVAGVTVVFLSILLIPNHLKTITLRSNNETTNAYYYLPKGEYTLLIKSTIISTPEDSFLVVWPYNVVFPGVSGRKSFNGHPLLTIRAEEKDTQAEAFFARKMNDREMQSFLRTHQIAYVIAYPMNPLPSFLSPALAEGSLILYKVER